MHTKQFLKKKAVTVQGKIKLWNIMQQFNYQAQ